MGMLSKAEMSLIEKIHTVMTGTFSSTLSLPVIEFKSSTFATNTLSLPGLKLLAIKKIN